MNKTVFPWNKHSTTLQNEVNQLKVQTSCVIREGFIKNSESLANKDK